MTIHDASLNAFPSDGKVLVVGGGPIEGRIEGLYHNRAYFRTFNEVQKPSDIPERTKAALIYSEPAYEHRRVLSLVAGLPYSGPFKSQIALSQILAGLLRGVDTLVDPDKVPKAAANEKPRLPESIRQPGFMPAQKILTPSSGGENKPSAAPKAPAPAANDKQFVLSMDEIKKRIGQNANLKAEDDDHEGRRLFILLEGAKHGLSVEFFKREFQIFRAKKFPSRPAPPLRLDDEKPQPITQPVRPARPPKLKPTNPVEPVTQTPTPEKRVWISMTEFALAKHDPQVANLSELARSLYPEMKTAGLGGTVASLVSLLSDVRRGIIKEAKQPTRIRRSTAQSAAADSQHHSKDDA